MNRHVAPTSLDDIKIFLSEGTASVHMVLTVGGVTDMSSNPVNARRFILFCL